MSESKLDLFRKYGNKAYRIIKQQGIRAFFLKLQHRLLWKRQYRRFFLMNRTTSDQLDQQRHSAFNENPKISLLVPLFNTPENFLRELIQSVQNQTYAEWQLCFADGSTQPEDKVGSVVMEYVRNDTRISYLRLHENLGISGNTNACLGLATGTYIGLFDHDDLLAPDALYEVVKAINETEADFIYTDEMCFEGRLDNVTHIHFKPDFAIDNLRSNNYICHFSVFRKSLIDQVGNFDDRFNGSQDYDIILRLTEKASKIHHIAKVLYYWRVHSASVASDLSAKPYAITAARNALKAHLDRCGLKGDVLDSSMLSTYKIQYELNNIPKIHIFVIHDGSHNNLNRCIDSIKKGAYGNIEITVVKSDDGASHLLSEADFAHNMRNKGTNQQGNPAWLEHLNQTIRSSDGTYILILDSKLVVQTSAWIEEMLMFAQRSDVAVVGAKVFSRDHRVLHAGIGLGGNSTIGYYFLGFDRMDPGYVSRLSYAQNVTAVSGGCLMISKTKYMNLGGFDPVYNRSLYDIDLCMKARESGDLVVFTPYAELMSELRYTSGKSEIRPESNDASHFNSKWSAFLQRHDPYYNVNLSSNHEDFSVRH